MRACLLVLAAAGLSLVAGCSNAPEPEPSPPKVDFSVATKRYTARPFLYCDVKVTDCKRDNTAQLDLEVAPGTPVRVRVPKEVADTPWSVVIQYRTAAGKQTAPQTVATFGPGKADTYEAVPPGKGDQLQTIEVKQAGGKLVTMTSGEREPVTRGVWSAQVSAPKKGD